ncbi:hypothetical protein CRENBAI_007681 [Crenichthys baileyi]|uniref:Uncharacterized protein n=1 Tax=Crenichthys baileyi TaxID=28760 RepID=A0AAV9SDN6_9TELE
MPGTRLQPKPGQWSNKTHPTPSPRPSISHTKMAGPPKCKLWASIGTCTNPPPTPRQTNQKHQGQDPTHHYAQGKDASPVGLHSPPRCRTSNIQASQYEAENPDATAEPREACPTSPTLGGQSRRTQDQRPNTTARHTVEDRMQQRAPIAKAHTMQMGPHQPSKNKAPPQKFTPPKKRPTPVQPDITSSQPSRRNHADTSDPPPPDRIGTGIRNQNQGKEPETKKEPP